MAKQRSGLHKEISSIFDGVPIPKGDQVPQAPSKSAPKRTGYKEQSSSNTWRLGTSAPQRTSAQAAKPAGPAKRERPEQSPAKTTTTEQPKADGTAETSKQNLLQKIWQEIETRFLAPKPGVSPARQKAMVILVPVLFVVLIFVLLQVLGPAPRGTRGGTENGTVNTVAAGSTKIGWQIPELYPASLRDPMQLPRATTPTAVQSGQLTVTGILYSEGNPSSSSASINGRPVYEGETILGATVVKIYKDSVEFEMSGRTWTQRVVKR
jgi:hypothetical protein